MKKSNCSIWKAIFTLTLVIGIISLCGSSSYAKKVTRKKITYNHKVVAYQTSSEVCDFVPTGSASGNRQALNYLMSGNQPKVINIKNNISIDTYLRPGNNTTINAGKYTITSNTGVIINDPTAASYGNLKNLTINGGIWKNSSSEGLKGTMMRIGYAENITIKNATVYSNYTGHGIELISCNKAVVSNCTLKAQGKCPKDCVEEQLQIDLSTPKTAPGLYRINKKLCNGTPSKNITVKNCTIQGSRGICANFAGSESNYRKAGNYHSNITISNCKVTGISAEAIALFNTKSASIKNCRITTKTPLKRNSYSVGLAVVYQNGSSPKTNLKNVVTISNNVVKGGRQGIFVYSHTSQKFGTVVVKGNKAYAKKGKANAIQVLSAKKARISKNTTRKW